MAFCGNPLDRASDRRTDPAWLAAQQGCGLFLPFWQNKPLVVKDRAGFLPWRSEWQAGLCVFLGLDGARPLFAVDVAGDSEPVMEDGAFAEMRASAFVLPGRDTAIAGDTATDYDTEGHFLVLCEGDFDQETVSAAQLNGAALIFAWAAEQFGITTNTLASHKEVTPVTSCPGTTLESHLTSGDLKRRIDDVITAGFSLTPVSAQQAAPIVAAIEAGTR
jgi:hypothetical protein